MRALHRIVEGGTLSHAYFLATPRPREVDSVLNKANNQGQALTIVHDPKNTFLVVFAATAAQMVVAMSNVVLPTIAPKLAESLAVSAVLIGYQVSLTFGVATLVSMFGGTAVLRWGAACMTQVSNGCCAAGLLLFLLPHWSFIALGSVAVGTAMGLLTPAAAHMLVKYTQPKRRNLVFSIKQTGVPVGGVIIALTAPALAVTVGWQWSVAVVFVLIAVLAVAVAPHRNVWDDDRNPAASLKQQPFGGLPMVWRHASLRWLSLVSLLFSAIQRCLLTFTVIYLVAEAGYGLIEAGVILSMLQIGGSVSRVPWGWLADRTGSSAAVLAIICIITISGTGALVFLSADWPRPLVYILFLALGAAAVGWNGVFHAEAARLSPPGMASLVAGGTAIFIFGGVLVGPSLFAAAYLATGSYSTTFLLLAGVAVAALVLLVLAHRAAQDGEAASARAAI
jgi:MFS family permease